MCVCVCVCVRVCVCQPRRKSRMRHNVNFKQILIDLNSEFSFFKKGCHSKAKELCLSYYLPIAGGRIIGFTPFPMILALGEMQAVSFWIWIHVTGSIW